MRVWTRPALGIRSIARVQPGSSRERPVLMPLKLVPVPGAELEVLESGSGDPVIFSERSWTPVDERERARTLITLERKTRGPQIQRRGRFFIAGACAFGSHGHNVRHVCRRYGAPTPPPSRQPRVMPILAANYGQARRDHGW